jgi:Protein of unknown function (DUF2934)
VNRVCDDIAPSGAQASITEGVRGLHAEIEINSTTRRKDSGMTLKGKRDETLQLHASPIQPHAEDTSANHSANQDAISRRAYEIYLERGSLPGRELEDWLQAEREFESAALFMRAAIGEKHRP